MTAIYATLTASVLLSFQNQAWSLRTQSGRSTRPNPSALGAHQWAGRRRESYVDERRGRLGLPRAVLRRPITGLPRFRGLGHGANGTQHRAGAGAHTDWHPGHTPWGEQSGSSLQGHPAYKKLPQQSIRPGKQPGLWCKPHAALCRCCRVSSPARPHRPHAARSARLHAEPKNKNCQQPASSPPY